ncbi:6-hydroxy-D-nicotine oxidase 1 [Seiridium cupressi]
MEVITAGIAYVINNASARRLLVKLGLASLITITPDFPAELGPRLSPGASIILPGDANFANITTRWREWHGPSIAAVVAVATEDDIRYANEYDMPFLARAGGHGATEALASATNAIQIDFRNLNQVKLSNDGQTATIGGGATVKAVVGKLMQSGKQAVTGICECVGISAPILGGGHGWLQGQYGLLADQVISARLVLASGEAVTVSEDLNPDLFWAIRGAGHNFGLVTEWRYRVYDIRNSKWSYEIFIFSGDKLEALYELTNKMLHNQPPEVTHWGYIIKVAEIDPDHVSDVLKSDGPRLNGLHPIIWYAIVYDGPVSTARSYAKPFHDIGPLLVDAGEATVPELAALTFQDEDGTGCRKGLTSQCFPIGLESYNTASIRKVYDEIDETLKAVPELAGSFFLLEGYSTQGVQAVDARTTAFPHRGDKILVTPYIQYEPNATMDPIAEAFGQKLRRYLLERSDNPSHLRAYVNYAHGDESLPEVYGWEDWRLEKLKKLKSQWDPHKRMRYYVPIV